MLILLILWPGGCVSETQHVSSNDLGEGGVAPSNHGHNLLSDHLSQPGIARWSLPGPQDGKAESWATLEAETSQINSHEF